MARDQLARVAHPAGDSRCVEPGQPAETSGFRAGDVVAPIETVNDANGLLITPRTGLPTWTGERLDLGWAISALHPGANPLPHAPA